MDRRRVLRRGGRRLIRCLALIGAVTASALVVTALDPPRDATTLALLPAAQAAEDPAEILSGANVKARLANAAALKEENITDLVNAFAAMAERKVKKGMTFPDDVEFLSEYVVAENTRALRMMAIAAGRNLGREAFAERIRALADGENRGPTARAAEALGYVGGEADYPRLLELAASSSQSIAVMSCEALAKIGDKKATPEALVGIALKHESAEIADHALWAAQDLYKSQKTTLKKLKKLAGKDELVAVRKSSLEAMLLDGSVPIKWDPKVLDNAVKGITRAAPAVAIQASDKKYRKRIDEALLLLKEELPGAFLVVRTAVARIECPGSRDPKSHIDLDNFAVCVPFSYGRQSPKQLAYHIMRAGTVLFEKRIGNPHTGHRGWENAIFDTFDLCKLTGLYDAGRGGINRDQFLETIIAKRPWGGN